jgi:hypothetical protein
MDWVFEKDIAAAVLTTLQQQIVFADDARKMLQAKKDQLLLSIEKQSGAIIRLQAQIEKTKATKMILWEKYKNSMLSAEEFQRKNEKAFDVFRSCKSIPFMVYFCHDEL